MNPVRLQMKSDSFRVVLALKPGFLDRQTGYFVCNCKHCFTHFHDLDNLTRKWESLKNQT